MRDPIRQLASELIGKWCLDPNPWANMTRELEDALRQAQQVQREQDAQIAETLFPADGRVGTQSLIGEHIAKAIRERVTLRSQEIP